MLRNLKFSHLISRVATVTQESQDRTRKRIKEDLKSAEIGYNEYADTLLKLKTRYIRRCQDAEVGDYTVLVARP